MWWCGVGVCVRARWLTLFDMMSPMVAPSCLGASCSRSTCASSISRVSPGASVLGAAASPSRSDSPNAVETNELRASSAAMLRALPTSVSSLGPPRAVLSIARPHALRCMVRVSDATPFRSS